MIELEGEVYPIRDAEEVAGAIESLKEGMVLPVKWLGMLKIYKITREPYYCMLEQGEREMVTFYTQRSEFDSWLESRKLA
jgi:hypothetical protein